MTTNGHGFRQHLPVISLPHLWAVATLAAVFAACGLSTIALGDFWWHLRLGEVIANTGQIPREDIYSFVAYGIPFVYQQWLGELYLYLLFRLGGLELVVLANTLTLTAVAAVTLLASWEASRSLRLSSICAMAGMLIALPNRDVRPQVLGFLFFALFYLILRRYRQGQPTHLWVLPLLMAVWVNVHGSAVIGLGLCAVVFGAELADSWLGIGKPPRLARDKLFKLGLATASLPLAMLANPWGPGFFAYVTTIQQSSVVQSLVTEWFAPVLHNPADMPFFAILLACVATFAVSPRSLSLSDAAIFVVFSALALQAGRNSAWFGIVAAPIAAQQLVAIAQHRYQNLDNPLRAAPAGDATKSPSSSQSRLSPNLATTNLLFALLIGGFALLTIPWIKASIPLPAKYQGLIDGDTPIGAVQYVTQHLPSERFFHLESYGSYMIWASPARPLVFVDTRIELYSPEVWGDYVKISQGVDWQERLANYGIRHVIVTKSQSTGFQSPLIRELVHSDGWYSLYEDDVSIIYALRS